VANQLRRPRDDQYTEEILRFSGIGVSSISSAPAGSLYAQ